MTNSEPHPNWPGSDPWIWAQERPMWESADDDVPALSMIHQASLGLVAALDFDRTNPHRDNDDRVLNAISLSCILAFRALRSAAVMIACGYSAEALFHARRIMELARFCEVLVEHPEAKSLAEQWWRGRHSTSRYLDQDINSVLSESAHGNAIHMSRISTGEEDDWNIALFGNRHEDDEMIATTVAMAARDVAVVAHEAFRMSTEAFEGLELDIQEVLDRHVPLDQS